MQKPGIAIGGAALVAVVFLAFIFSAPNDTNDSSDEGESSLPVPQEEQLDGESQEEEVAQSLQAEIEKERQLSLERQHQEFVQQTSQSWQKLLAAHSAFLENETMNSEEQEWLLQNITAQVQAIPTNNIDAELASLITNYHAAFSNLHQLSVYYNDNLMSLDRNQGSAALQGCGRSLSETTAEGFWGQAFSCIAGGTVSAGGSALAEGVEEGLLEADMESKFEKMQEPLAQVAQQMETMPGYLETEYGIIIDQVSSF
jgi:hypothetical protein